MRRTALVSGLMWGVASVVDPGNVDREFCPWDAEGPAPKAVLFGRGTISTGDDEAHPPFSPEGRRVYYIKDSPDFRHWTVVEVDWTSRGWGRAQCCVVLESVRGRRPVVRS